MPDYTEYSYAKVLSNYMEKHSLYESLYIREKCWKEVAVDKSIFKEMDADIINALGEIFKRTYENGLTQNKKTY